MNDIRRTIISWALTLIGIGAIAAAEPIRTIAEAGDVFGSGSISSTSTNTNQRRLKIEIAISEPEDLKVKEGDSIQKGQVLADREKERSSLVYQKKQTELAIARIEQAALLPPPKPLPVPPIKGLPQVTYAEQEAEVASAELKFNQAQRNYHSALSLDPYISTQAEVNLAKSKVAQAQRNVDLAQRKVDAIATLKNLPPEVVTHEVEKLKLTQSEADQVTAEYQYKQSEFENAKQRRRLQLEELAEKVDAARSALELTQAKLRTARDRRDYDEYEHSITMARRTEEANQANISYARQEQEFAQQQRDREFQLAQLNGKLAEINDKLTKLAVVRSPYDGKISRIKTERQTDNTLRVVVSLDPNPVPNAADVSPPDF